MTNRDRRKLVGSIFADTAKYSLTAGVIGGIISGNISIKVAVVLGIVVTLMGILAYVVTPEDKQ